MNAKLHMLTRTLPEPAAQAPAPAGDLASTLEAAINKLVEQRVSDALAKEREADAATDRVLARYMPRQANALSQPGQDHLQAPSGGWAQDDADPLDRQRPDQARPAQREMSASQQTAFLGDMRHEPISAESRVLQRDAFGGVVSVETIYNPPTRAGIARAVSTVSRRDETGAATATKTTYFNAAGDPC